MSRSRNIKPGFFKNEQLAELPFEYRMLFQGLWCEADREGRLEDRPKRIKAEIFPYDNVDVDAGLDALQAAGFICRYQVEDRRCIEVFNFAKHQNPHKKETASSLPARVGTEPTPETPDLFTERPGNSGTSPADSPILIPDSPLPATVEEERGVSDEERAIEACKQIEALGFLHPNPSGVDILAAFSEGVTVKALVDHYRAASKMPKVKNPFSYAITAARNDRKAGAASVSSPDPPRPTMGSSGPTESPLEKEINLAWHEFNYGRLSAEQRDSHIEAAKIKHDAARNSEAAAIADSRLPFGDNAHQQGVT